MHGSLADIQVHLICFSFGLLKPLDDPLVINFEKVSVGIFCLKWLFWFKCCKSLGTSKLQKVPFLLHT